MSTLLSRATLAALLVLPVAALLSLLRGNLMTAGFCLLLFSMVLFVRETRTGG